MANNQNLPKPDRLDCILTNLFNAGKITMSEMAAITGAIDDAKQNPNFVVDYGTFGVEGLKSLSVIQPE